MKKYIVLALTVLMVLGLVGGVVGATFYDNWQGTMTGRDVTRDGHYYGDAEGELVFNYRKGQADFMVKVEALGLSPNTEYQIRTNYNKPDGELVREHIVYVTSDDCGYLFINFRGYKPGFAEIDDYEMDARFLVVRKSDGWRVLTTAEAGGGTLEDAGSNRGE